jgi:hypothetical protein
MLATCFHAGFLLGLFFDPEDGGDVPPKRRLIFQVTTQHSIQDDSILLDTSVFFTI